MKSIHICETCLEEVSMEDFPEILDDKEGLTDEREEGIINKNYGDSVVTTLCRDCHEEIYGEGTILPFLKEPYNH